MDPRVSIDSRLTTGTATTDELESPLAQSLEYTDDSLISTNRERGSYGATDDRKQSCTMIALSEFDQFSVHTTCPHCGQETDTLLRHHTGSATFKCFALLMILTCGLLSWLPFILNDFKDVDHLCQHCGKTVATYKRRFISR